MLVTSNRPLHSVTLTGRAAQRGACCAKANTVTSQHLALGGSCNAGNSWCSVGHLGGVAFRQDPEHANAKLIKELSLGALLCVPKPAPELHARFPAGSYCSSASCLHLPRQTAGTEGECPPYPGRHRALAAASGASLGVRGDYLGVKKGKEMLHNQGPWVLEQRNHNASFIDLCLH